jgi:hypothetical protein
LEKSACLEGGGKKSKKGRYLKGCEQKITAIAKLTYTIGLKASTNENKV